MARIDQRFYSHCPDSRGSLSNYHELERMLFWVSILAALALIMLAMALS